MAKNNVLVRSKKKRALALFRSSQLEEAKTLYTQITKSNKHDFDAWHMLGTINWGLGSLDSAEIQLAHALKIRPHDPVSHYKYACILLAKDKKEHAEDHFTQAITLKADYAEAHVALGNILATSGKLEDAANCYYKALKLSPAHPVLYCNLGNVLADQGRTKEAIESWRKAIAMQHNYASAHSNLLLCLNYDTSQDPIIVYKEHLTWAERHAKPIHRNASHTNSPDQNRALRIGYVSADLREHSVAYFLEPILANHDHNNFTIFCYADVTTPDDTTKRLSPLINYYRNISGLTNERVSKIIIEDRIDILVDLAGHTSGNRLQVFAYKPAPVQASYLGYPNTTGMSGIDYRFTDALADPPDKTDHLYTEKLYRLNSGFLCYKPPADAPAPKPPPICKNGYVTFGAFNAVTKTNQQVISLWIRILQANPNSRLILKTKSFSDPATCQRYRKLFTDHDIDPARIETIGLTASKTGHLAVYNQIDIALDTFPYNGTTTTCDTLWMGIPVVTLAGTVHAGRVGVSLLSLLGMEELIANTMDEYASIATRVAMDAEYLKNLRSTLRQTMSTSSLCNGKTFTQELETAYRVIWRKWCKPHIHNTNTAFTNNAQG